MRDYLLHDRVFHPLTWQDTVQIEQACETSRISLHGPATAAAGTSTKAGALSLDEHTCAPAESIAVQRENKVHEMGVRKPARTLPKIFPKNILMRAQMHHNLGPHNTILLSQQTRATRLRTPNQHRPKILFASPPSQPEILLTIKP